MAETVRWVHREGDPVFLRRRWDGTQWGDAVDLDSHRDDDGQIGKSLEAQSAMSQLLIALVGLVSVLYLRPVMQRLLLLLDDPTGRARFDALRTTNETLETLVRIGAVCSTLAGVAFIRWFAHAYRNLALCSAVARHPRSGWSAWLIPPGLLWRPYTMMLELLGASSTRPSTRRTRLFTLVWWALIAWLPIAVWVVQRYLPNTRNGLIASDLVALLEIVVLIPLNAGLAIWLLRQVTARQEAQLATLRTPETF